MEKETIPKKFGSGYTLKNGTECSLIKPGAIIIDGHVQGLSNTRSLGEAGIPVIVIDSKNCIARYSNHCTQYFQCPEYLSQEFIFFLINLAIKENLWGWLLIPSNDHAVINISQNRSSLEKYYKIITPNINIVANIYDKSKLLKIAENCGIPIPITQYFLAPSDPLNYDLVYPVITKGRNGLSFYKAMGKTAFLANNEIELRNQLAQINKIINLSETFTQEVIIFDGTNKTISFTAFCDQGDIKTHWMGVKHRQHPLQFGTATFAESISIEKCLIQSIPLLKALNYTGVCEVEYLYDPKTKQYKLIEINARTWLWVGLAKACGVNFAMIIYDYLNGNLVNYPKSYTIGIFWINPISDTIYALLGILKGQLSLKEYFSSLISNQIVNAIFLKNDLRPGFAYLMNMLSFLIQR